VLRLVVVPAESCPPVGAADVRRAIDGGRRGSCGATLVAPSSWSGPFAAVLITPELTCLAVSFGADEPTAKVLGAAAVVLVVIAIAGLVRPRAPLVLATRFLAALQLVVAVALVVAGMRDI
jgi:hypothetical protein